MTNPKRFYKEVSIEGGQLLLDGKSVKTRSGKAVAHASRKLMESVAEEWAGREKDINYREMPLTRLLMAALELDDAARSALTQHMLGYAETDLICYYAPDDAVLAAKQRVGWNPWLEWLREKYGVTLHFTSGIIPVPQEEEALSRLRNHVEQKTGEELVALNELTATLGSIVLALAVLEGALDASPASELSMLDESHQAERWGEDTESTHHRKTKAGDISAVERFLHCL